MPNLPTDSKARHLKDGLLDCNAELDCMHVCMIVVLHQKATIIQPNPCTRLRTFPLIIPTGSFGLACKIEEPSRNIKDHEGGSSFGQQSLNCYVQECTQKHFKLL